MFESGLLNKQKLFIVKFMAIYLWNTIKWKKTNEFIRSGNRIKGIYLK